MEANPKRVRLFGFLWLIWCLCAASGDAARAQTNLNFSWSGVPASVAAGQPFPAVLQTFSTGGMANTNFNGTVSASEVVPQESPGVLITEIQPFNTNRIELANLSSTAVDVSGWQVVFYDNASWPAPKAAFTLPAATVCPASGTLEIRASGSPPGVYPTFYTGVGFTWSSDVGVLLLDATGNAVDFFCAGNAYPAFITTPYSIGEALWSGPPAVLISASNPALTYQRRGSANHHNAADWIAATNSFLVLNPSLQLPFLAPATNAPAIPASVTVTNGAWSGQIAVGVPATNALLRADNGQGISGDSSPLVVLSLPALNVSVPHAASKSTAGLVGQGEVSITTTVSTNVQVNISSSLTNEIIVPGSVQITAGTTNSSFPVTNLNDGLLEGPQAATIQAAAAGFAPGSDVVTNYDAAGARVTISAPSTVLESSGWQLSGQVIASAAVSQNVSVQLFSSDTTQLVVPNSVIIPAGQSSAKFGFAPVNYSVLNGNHTVTLSASVPGWAGGLTQVVVKDNKSTNLTLVLPGSLNEGVGTLTNAGTVQIGGILTTDLTVNLACSLPSVMQIPGSVVIPAGQSSAAFNVTVPSRGVADTNQSVLITASASGFNSALRSVSVIDNHVSSFAFGAVPQSIMSGQAFSITVNALNISGSVVPGYSASIGLHAAGNYGSVIVIPSTIGPFTNGMWSGFIALQGEGTNTIITADDGLGDPGSSGAISVVGGVQWNLPVSDFVYDPGRGIIQAALLSSASSNAQCAVTIDPVSGTEAGPVPLGSIPGKIAISDDSQFLYVALTSTGGVARVNLASRTVDLQFGVASAGSYPYVMAVPPGDPHALVGWISGNQGLALFRDGVAQPSTVGADSYNMDPYTLVFYDSSTNFYSQSGVYSYGLWPINSASNGLHAFRNVPGFPSGSTIYEGGLLFGSSGDIYEPIHAQHLGSYGASGMITADANADRVYFLSGNTLSVFDLTTFAPVGQINLPLSGGATKILACGTNGVAVATGNQLLLVQSHLFPPPPAANLMVSQSTGANVGVVGSNFTYTISVSNAGPATVTNAVLADLVPADVVFVLETNSQGSGTLTNGIVRCPLGAMAPGDNVTTTLVLQPGTPGTTVNRAWVIGNGLNLANGTSRQTNTVVFGSVLPAVTRLWLNADDMAYDTNRSLLWICTERFGGALENNLRSISLTNGLPQGVFSVGNPMNHIALSADQNYLYAAYPVGPPYSPGSYLLRLNQLTSTIDENFHVVDPVNQDDPVADLIGLPTYPSDIVASRNGVNGDVVVYENGAVIRRSATGQGGGYLEINPSISSRIYMSSGGDFVRESVTSTNVTELPGNLNIGGKHIRFGGGLLFSDSGGVADPEALTNTTQLPVSGLVQTDPVSGLAYYVVQNGAGWTLDAFDEGALTPVWSFPVPGASGNAASLIRCGPGILAFKTDYEQIFILNTASLPHALQSDVSVSESASAATATTNIQVTFQTTIQNSGPAPTLNVVITNQLPPDAIVGPITSSQGTNTNTENQILCYVGNLAAGQSAWLKVVATLGHAGALTNYASAGGSSPDMIVSNNYAAAVTTFNVIPVSDVAVTQVLPSAPVVVGSNVAYTLTVTNQGPSDASNVILSDSFPSGATIVSFTTSQGSLGNSGTSVSGNLGLIPNGSSATVSLVVIPADPGLLVNTASVSSDNQDSNPANNQSTTTLPVIDSASPALAEEILLPTSDIAYDLTSNAIIASLASAIGPYSNGVVSLDATSIAIDSFVSAGTPLGRLALSDDYHYAYAGQSVTGGVARVDLQNLIVDEQFAIITPPNAQYGPYVAQELAVMPGSPDTLVVARKQESGYDTAVTLFDSGIQRPDVINAESYFWLAFPNATNVYISWAGGFQVATVTPTGVTNSTAAVNSYVGDFATAGGLVFFANGTVIDPSTGTNVGTFPISGQVGLVAPDLANGRVYFLTGSGQGGFFWYLTVQAFNSTNYNQLWSVPFSSYIGHAARLITLGTNGVAFTTDANRLFVVRTAQLATPAADVSISQSVSPNPVSAGAPLTCNFSVQNSGPWTASDVVVSNPIPAGASFVSATSSQGTCTLTNGCLLCALGSLSKSATATLTVHLLAPPAGTSTNVAIVTLDQSDPAPTNNTAAAVIQVNPQPLISAGDAVVQQQPTLTTIVFPITLSRPSSAPVSAKYQTADGTALAGQQYNAATGTVTFNPGSTSAQLLLSIIRTNASHSSENYFYLNLVTATNGLLGRAQATGTIVQTVFYNIFALGGLVENRGADTNALFSIMISPTSAVPVSVQYQTVDGSAIGGVDYSSRAGTLVFNPGVTNLTLNVPVIGNSSIDTTKTFSVVLSQPQNAVLTVDQVTGTILDDALIAPLVIAGAQLQGGNIMIQFNSINGRSYRMQRSTNLVTGSWTTVADQIPGNGGLVTISDSVAASPSSQFYRLVLLP